VANSADLFFSFFLFLCFFFFLNHMFIVSTVQEMTCIFNDMAKTKPKIKLTINKRNKQSKTNSTIATDNRHKAAVANKGKYKPPTSLDGQGWVGW